MAPMRQMTMLSSLYKMAGIVVPGEASSRKRRRRNSNRRQPSTLRKDSCSSRIHRQSPYRTATSMAM